MLVSERCGHAAARCALDESLHDEERLVHLLDGSGILADGRSYRRHSHGTPAELVDDGQENLIVGFIESVLVDIQSLESHLRYLARDASVALYLRKVAHTAQQRVGYSGRSAAAFRYLHGGIVVDGHLQQARRAV